MCFRNAKFGFRLILSLAESVFFSGLLCGWVYLCDILIHEGFFSYECPPSQETPLKATKHGDNTSNHTAIDTIGNLTCSNTSSWLQYEQEHALYRLYLTAMVTSTLLMIPCGLMFDFLGTLKTRMISIMMFTASMLMLTFINKSGSPFLLYTGLTLASTSGLVFLMTNLQVANLFPRWRATAILSYHVTYQLGFLVAFSMKMTNQSGLNIQSSFMFYTVGVIPLIISTIALLPRRPIPCPLTRPYAEKHETLTNYIHWWKRGNEGSKIFGDRMTCHSMRAELLNPRFTVHLLWVFVFTLAFDMAEQPTYAYNNHEYSPAGMVLSTDEKKMALSIKYGFLIACPLAGIILDFSLSNDILEIFRGGFRKRYSLYCTILWCLSVPLLITRMVAPEGITVLQHIDAVLWTLMLGGSAAHIYTALPYRAFGTLYSVTMFVCRLATITRIFLQYLLWWYFRSTRYTECWRLAVLALMLPYPLQLWLQSRTVPPTEVTVEEEGDGAAISDTGNTSQLQTINTRLASQAPEPSQMPIMDGETSI